VLKRIARINKNRKPQPLRSPKVEIGLKVEEYIFKKISIQVVFNASLPLKGCNGSKFFEKKFRPHANLD
jgi:hypothetical protein